MNCLSFNKFSELVLNKSMKTRKQTLYNDAGASGIKLRSSLNFKVDNSWEQIQMSDNGC